MKRRRGVSLWHRAAMPFALLSAIAAAPLPARGALPESRASMPAPAAILAAAERAATWQLDHRTDFGLMPLAAKSVRDPRDWQQATFWVALTELADRSRDPRYAAALLDLGRSLGWRLGDRPLHADDQLIAQAWLWDARHGAGDVAVAPARAYFDALLRARPAGDLRFLPNPAGHGDPPCTDRWCWADALFMAPPTLLRLTAATGDPRYAAFAHSEYRAAADYLYDPAEQLFFRDSRFLDRRDGAGRKLFWSRGNGWVFAGMARMIPLLPPGSAIVNTASIEAYKPSRHIVDYAMTKAAIANFTKGMAPQLLDRGIRINAVAPGPIWTAMQPAGQPPEMVPDFGAGLGYGRPGQPAELAPVYVLLASQEASFITGEVYGVTGGMGTA